MPHIATTKVLGAGGGAKYGCAEVGKGIGGCRGRGQYLGLKDHTEGYLKDSRPQWHEYSTIDGLKKLKFNAEGANLCRLKTPMSFLGLYCPISCTRFESMLAGFIEGTHREPIAASSGHCGKGRRGGRGDYHRGGCRRS